MGGANFYIFIFYVNLPIYFQIILEHSFKVSMKFQRVSIKDDPGNWILFFLEIKQNRWSSRISKKVRASHPWQGQNGRRKKWAFRKTQCYASQMALNLGLQYMFRNGTRRGNVYNMRIRTLRYSRQRVSQSAAQISALDEWIAHPNKCVLGCIARNILDVELDGENILHNKIGN